MLNMLLLPPNLDGFVRELQNNLKNWGTYGLNIVIISRSLRILTSQNRFQSLHDEIFIIDRFLE